MAIFCFDIDGTITPHRNMIDSAMFSLLEKLAINNEIWLITGNNADKAKYQIGDLFNIVDRVYCCSGSELWKKGVLVKQLDYKFDNRFIATIYALIEKCPIKMATKSKHVIFSTGIIKVSIPGYSITKEERLAFIEWDKKSKFREKCVRFINKQYPELKASLAGQTSIDITPASGGKVAVLQDIPSKEKILFWCDEAFPLGNDYEFAEGLTKLGGIVMPVNNWQETYHQVREILYV